MALEKKNQMDAFSLFFDGQVFTPLFEGQAPAVKAAFGLVGGMPAYAVAQNSRPMGLNDVELCCKTLDLAAKTGNPVVTFYNSSGFLLEQGQKTMQAAARLSAKAAQLSGVVLQVAVVLGVCGASSALAAAGADLCIMGPEGELFLTPPFLSAAQGDALQQAGSPQFAAKAGIAAITAPTNEQAVQQAARVVALLPGNNLSAPASFEFMDPEKPYSPGEPSAAGVVHAIADGGSALLLYEGYGQGVEVAFATVCGTAVGIVATNPGQQNCLTAACAAKTARFVRLCDAFSVPVVSVVNSPGFAQSSTQDQAGSIRQAARLAATYADATTAKVAVLAGQVQGAVYTAFALADLTIALEGAVIAPAQPTAMVSVLHKEQIESAPGSIQAQTEALAKEYEQQHASAKAALQNGLADFVATEDSLRGQILASLDILSSKREQRLPKKHGNMAL